MKSAAERITHYENRMTSSQIDPVLAAVNAEAVANFGTYAVEFVAKQQELHDYLDGEGALPAEYFNYNAFNGEMYHIWKHFAGAAAIAAGGDMVIKYTGMGCTGIRLRAIASLLYNIVIP